MSKHNITDDKDYFKKYFQLNKYCTKYCEHCNVNIKAVNFSHHTKTKKHIINVKITSESYDELIKEKDYLNKLSKNELINIILNKNI